MLMLRCPGVLICISSRDEAASDRAAIYRFGRNSFRHFSIVLVGLRPPLKWWKVALWHRSYPPMPKGASRLPIESEILPELLELDFGVATDLL